MNDAFSIEAPFAVSFPLPFRALFLAGTGLLCWATNLHALHAFGIDVAAALDLRPHDAYTLRFSAPGPPDALALARAVYRLFCAYALWTFTGWAAFRLATHGELELVDVYKFMPAVTALSLVMFAVSPFNILEKRVRDQFLLAIRRCLFSPTTMPVYFSDIVLADIFTSHAKVIGDVWLSFCMVMPGGSLLIFPFQDGWTRLMVPCLMSIPYCVRFRQCMIDYMQPTTTTRRSLYNALKYASSFPVIFLSAAQRIVVADLMTEEGMEVDDEAWHGEHPLFRLWLLSIVVNSLYSFWWDVTNDWGLELLRLMPDVPRHQPPRPLLLPNLHAHNSTLDSSTATMHARHPSFTYHPSNERTDSFPASSFSPRRYPWGLRPKLLYPLPAYPLALFANLVLRLTWSLKLSAHLHVGVSGALVFFWLELAELLRRWVWVFFRVEWECVRRSAEHGEHAPEIHDLDGGVYEDRYEDLGTGMGMGTGEEMEMGNASMVLDSQEKAKGDP